MIQSWDDEKLNLKDKLLRGVFSYGFENPSSIQKQAIYPLIYGRNGVERDIIAQAQSGTGKTGAFSIGSLNNVDEDLKETQVIILSPTRELADQTFKVITELSLINDN